jgi:hypothetical protein
MQLLQTNSRLYGLRSGFHACVCLISNMWWVVLEFYCNVHIYTYLLSAYLMIFMVFVNLSLIRCVTVLNTFVGAESFLFGGQLRYYGHSG